MLHEASVQHSIYSPDNASPRAASPVFVLSSFAEQGTPHTNGVATDVQTQAGPMAMQGNRVEEFFSALSTPLQQPLLPAPDVNVRRPSRAKRYKKPLSPSSLKTIAELVEKGGCKTIRLKATKKKAAVAPL